MSKLFELIRTDVSSCVEFGLKDVIAKKVVEPRKLQALSALMIAAHNAAKAYFPGCPRTVISSVSFELFKAAAETIDNRVDEFREKFRRDFCSAIDGESSEKNS